MQHNYPPSKHRRLHRLKLHRRYQLCKIRWFTPNHECKLWFRQVIILMILVFNVLASQRMNSFRNLNTWLGNLKICSFCIHSAWLIRAHFSVLVMAHSILGQTLTAASAGSAVFTKPVHIIRSQYPSTPRPPSVRSYVHPAPKPKQHICMDCNRSIFFHRLFVVYSQIYIQGFCCIFERTWDWRQNDWTDVFCWLLLPAGRRCMSA